MSLELEQIMANSPELYGVFYVLTDEGKTVKRNVDPDFIPDHSTKRVPLAGADNGTFRKWTEKEDEDLLAARHEYLDWRSVRKMFNRCAKNCRARYVVLCAERGIAPILALPKQKKNEAQVNVARPVRITPVDVTPTFQELIAAVAFVMQVEARHIKGSARAYKYASARRLVYWIAHNVFCHSNAEIARLCGDRHHSTVTAALKTISDDIERHADCVSEVLDVLRPQWKFEKKAA